MNQYEKMMEVAKLNAELREEEWWYAFYYGLERIQSICGEYLASHCPKCEQELSEPEFEPADLSVGINWAGWYNECSSCRIDFSIDYDTLKCDWIEEWT